MRRNSQDRASASNANITILGNMVALLDVDETLAQTKSVERGDAVHEEGFWYLNETLVKALEDAGVKDVYFFTAYHARGVAKRPADLMISAPSRLILKEALEERGFRVHAVVVPYDCAYQQGPGKHYEDHIAPHEAVVKENQDLDASPESRYAADVAQEMRWSEENPSKSFDKGDMFEYLLEAVPELKNKRLVFVDDSRGHITRVQDKAVALNQPLEVIRCTYETTREDYLRVFSPLQLTQDQLVVKQNALDEAHKAEISRFFQTQSTKVARDKKHAKAFNAWALINLANRSLLRNQGVDYNPANAKKLLHLAYLLSETEQNQTRTRNLLAHTYAILASLGEDFIPSFEADYVNARELETQLFEGASNHEKAIYYFRLANLYQFEMDHAPANQIASLMIQSMEYYVQAWHLAYSTDRSLKINTLGLAYYDLSVNRADEFLAARESLIAGNEAHYSPFFNSMAEHFNEYEEQIQRIMSHRPR